MANVCKVRLAVVSRWWVDPYLKLLSLAMYPLVLVTTEPQIERIIQRQTDWLAKRGIKIVVE